MILTASPSEAALLGERGPRVQALPADAPVLSAPGAGLRALEVPTPAPVSVVRRPLRLDLRASFGELLDSGHGVRKQRLDELAEVSRLVVGLPNPQRSWLEADIRALASALRALSGAGDLLGSLYVTGTDHCRKFHSDACGWRLLVTYAGPGTQWIADQEAARVEMRRRYERTLDEHNAALIRAGGVRQAETGDVVVLRGDLLCRGEGAIHRSPPIQAAGLRRLVLKLDARPATAPGALAALPAAARS